MTTTVNVQAGSSRAVRVKVKEGETYVVDQEVAAEGSYTFYIYDDQKLSVQEINRAVEASPVDDASLTAA